MIHVPAGYDTYCPMMSPLVPVSEEEKASWPSNVLDVYILLYGVLDPANQKDHTDIQEWWAMIILYAVMDVGLMPYRLGTHTSLLSSLIAA